MGVEMGARFPTFVASVNKDISLHTKPVCKLPKIYAIIISSEIARLRRSLRNTLLFDGKAFGVYRTLFRLGGEKRARRDGHAAAEG